MTSASCRRLHQRRIVSSVFSPVAMVSSALYRYLGLRSGSGRGLVFLFFRFGFRLERIPWNTGKRDREIFRSSASTLIQRGHPGVSRARQGGGSATTAAASSSPRAPN